jgi:hypothetical protein
MVRARLFGYFGSCALMGFFINLSLPCSTSILYNISQIEANLILPAMLSQPCPEGSHLKGILASSQQVQQYTHCPGIHCSSIIRRSRGCCRVVSKCSRGEIL